MAQEWAGVETKDAVGRLEKASIGRRYTDEN